MDIETVVVTRYKCRKGCLHVTWDAAHQCNKPTVAGKTRIEQRKRAVGAAQMAIDGATFREVGDALGVSGSRARDVVIIGIRSVLRWHSLSTSKCRDIRWCRDNKSMILPLFIPYAKHLDSGGL